MADYDWDLSGDDRRRVVESTRRQRSVSDAGEAYTNHAGGYYRFKVEDTPYARYARELQRYSRYIVTASEAVAEDEPDKFRRLKDAANKVHAGLAKLEQEWLDASDGAQ